MFTKDSTYTRVFTSLVDFILPKRTRVVRAEQLNQENVVAAVQTHYVEGVQITTLTRYQDRKTQDLIRAMKFDGSLHATRLCAQIFVDYLKEALAEHAMFSEDSLLTIIPLHSKRRFERGYDHMIQIPEHMYPLLPKGAALLVDPVFFVRIKDTKVQAHLARNERFVNMKNAFSVRNARQGNNKRIFILDDVTTTGATLLNAAKAAKKQGFVPICVALARA